ncbi:MAG: MazG-like family protein [Microgenomates group bacterium]
MSKKLESLIKEITKFNKARGWSPTFSDIAKSIVIEASELLEHFQWDESDKYSKGAQPKDWEEVGEEVADVFWYLATFSETAGINIPKVVEEKIKENEKKYPEEKFKGKHNDKFYKKQKRKYRLKKKKK